MLSTMTPQDYHKEKEINKYLNNKPLEDFSSERKMSVIKLGNKQMFPSLMSTNNENNIGL